MLEEDVPQDEALFGELKELCYALDRDGRYVLVESAGWEPANIANIQAWETIRAEVADVLARIRAGELSTLAYHMARRQMTPKLLAGQMGLTRLRVGWRRHHILRRHVGAYGGIRPIGQQGHRGGSILQLPNAAPCMER